MLNQHAQSKHLDILLYGFSGNTQGGNAHRLRSAVQKKLPRIRTNKTKDIKAHSPLQVLLLLLKRKTAWMDQSNRILQV